MVKSVYGCWKHPSPNQSTIGVVDMTSKNCTKCKTLKPLTGFGKCKTNDDGLNHRCKYCCTVYAKEISKTKNGLVTKIYSRQRCSSRERGDVMPNYSLVELRKFVFSDDKFNDLYDNWVKSDYKKDLVPSCDRLDDYKPYTLENLQLTTWGYNNKRHYSDMKNGINNKNNMAIIQKGINGDVIDRFHSQCHASRVLGISQGSISNCLNGLIKTCGGFKWERAE